MPIYSALALQAIVVAVAVAIVLLPSGAPDFIYQQF
jgi:hypothetical protein